jgi:hypothetical protein
MSALPRVVPSGATDSLVIAIRVDDNSATGSGVFAATIAGIDLTDGGTFSFASGALPYQLQSKADLEFYTILPATLNDVVFADSFRVRVVNHSETEVQLNPSATTLSAQESPAYRVGLDSKRPNRPYSRRYDDAGILFIRS